jgi:hypothetical protein
MRLTRTVGLGHVHQQGVDRSDSNRPASIGGGSVVVFRRGGAGVGLVGLGESPGAFHGLEPRERLLELGLGDCLLVDVEGVEGRLVQQAPLLVIAAPVQLVRVLQQLQARLDQPRSIGEILVRIPEALGEMASLPLDLAQLRLDLGLGSGAIGRDANEVLIACVQQGWPPPQEFRQ